MQHWPALISKNISAFSITTRDHTERGFSLCAALFLYEFWFSMGLSISLLQIGQGYTMFSDTSIYTFCSWKENCGNLQLEPKNRSIDGITVFKGILQSTVVCVCVCAMETALLWFSGKKGSSFRSEGGKEAKFTSVSLNRRLVHFQENDDCLFLWWQLFLDDSDKLPLKKAPKTHLGWDKTKTLAFTSSRFISNAATVIIALFAW